MTQTDLFATEANLAIEAAGTAADPEWRKTASAAIEALCQTGNDFTGDDIWRLLATTNAKTPEPRALGAVIREAVRAKKIYPTGMFRKSERRECHRRPLAVWRPNNYKTNKGEL